MISPTGKLIRGPDKWGQGEYGVSRGQRPHKGADYICTPGQDIIAPITGLIIREARPYPEGEFSGLLIRGKHIEIKMFYLKPKEGIIDSFINQGQPVGKAQDISEKYPGMIPHIHLEIDSVDPEIFTDFL